MMIKEKIQEHGYQDHLDNFDLAEQIRLIFEEERGMVDQWDSDPPS